MRLEVQNKRRHEKLKTDKRLKVERKRIAIEIESKGPKPKTNLKMEVRKEECIIN